MLAGFLLVVTALLIVIMKSGNGPDPASVDANPVLQAKAESRMPLHAATPALDPRGGFQGPAAAIRASTAQHETPAAAKDAAIEKIQDAATTYDPAQLAVIRPYLTSADPELRAAAVDAMIVLGDATAGAMLRQAAATIGPGNEATAMMKAADYVELPSANLKELTQKTRDKPSTGVPLRRDKK